MDRLVASRKRQVNERAMLRYGGKDGGVVSVLAAVVHLARKPSLPTLKPKRVGDACKKKERSILLSTSTSVEYYVIFMNGRRREMNAPQILLVDDDPALLQALPRMLTLRIQGIMVDLAPSAIDALKHIQRFDYDAIISDIMMPGLDGLELLSQIKVLRPTTPILLITGYMDPRLLQEAMNAGAYDFIQKPIDRLLLVAALNRAVQTRQLQRQTQQQQNLLTSYAQIIGPLGEGASSVVESRKPARQQSAPFQPPKWLL